MSSPIPAGGVFIFKDIVKAATDYLACKAQEDTKRKAIAAKLEAYLTTVNRQYDYYEKVLDSFNEDVRRAYSYADQILQSPEAIKDHDLLKAVLQFVATAHSRNVDGYVGAFQAGKNFGCKQGHFDRLNEGGYE